MAKREYWIQRLQAVAAAERALSPHPNQLPKPPMRDDPKKAALDRKLIGLGEEKEIGSWTEFLKCSEEELGAAVKAVGNSADKVRAYLKK